MPSLTDLMQSEFLSRWLAIYPLSALISAFLGQRAPRARNILPGLTFGLLHSFLHFRTLAATLAYAALSGLAYYVAVSIAVSFHDRWPIVYYGFAAGAAGAAGLALSVSLLSNRIFSMKSYGLTIALGGLGGIIFLYMVLRSKSTRPVEWLSIVAAYLLWQSGVGISIDLSTSLKPLQAIQWSDLVNGSTLPVVSAIIAFCVIAGFVSEKREDESDNSAAAGYRDLPAALTRHSSLALTYALLSVTLIYTLGIWPSPSLLFFAFIAPTMIAVIYVLGSSRALRLRLMIIWLSTTLIAWASRIDQTPWTANLLSVAMTGLLIYWLVLAVDASVADFGNQFRDQNGIAAVAWLLSTWGATLQLAFIALLIVRYLLGDQLSHSSIGSRLIGVLRLVRLTSPVTWLPSGILIVGIIFFAVSRFADLPYEATDFKNVLPAKLPPVVSEIVAAIRIPLWLVVVIIGFLGHFVTLLWQSLLEFGDKWLGRFALVCIALVTPVILLVVGHLSFLRAMSIVSINLSHGSGGLWAAAAMIMAVHSLILLALFLYVLATASPGLDILPIPIRMVPSVLIDYLVREGFPAAQATGKAFALYGIVFLAVPLASLLPGGAGWGTFSSCYTVLVILVASFYLSGRARKTRRERVAARASAPSDS
jgi:hypothetical protein